MKPLLAWIKKVRFIHTVRMEKGKPTEFVQRKLCFVWAPEFYEPKFLMKQDQDLTAK